MIVAKDVFESMINSPIRTLRGRVELFEGSTLASICGCHDRLIEFKIERIGEKNKLFGYGICQKVTTTLLDRDRSLNVTNSNSLEVEFGVGSDYIYPCPIFHVEEVSRDENNNNLTITGYDALYAASAHKVSELDLPNSYTIRQFAEACASVLGIPMKEVNDPSFDTLYEGGANFEGTETIREALNAVAEVTQTIYYLDKDWNLTFKRLDITGAPVVTIDKSKYYTLESKGAVVLSTITHATELGDDVTATTGEPGVTQYIRDNPFWELREDIDVLVDNALAASKGLTINQFACDWRGNYLLEIGDKIGIVTKDDNTITSFILDDTIEFNGALSGKTSWEYEEDKRETSKNPTSLGEVLKQTYARVDKQEKRIDLVASESSSNKEAIAQLQLSTSGISASVEDVKKQAEEVSGSLTTLNQKVEAQMTAEDITIQIKNEIDNGVSKVVTSTGYEFSDEGMTVGKTNSEMKTQITDDGMQVFKNDKAMLTANNTGVDATNLRANTYLIIGTNSRFENYKKDGEQRTACFWIGG